MTSEYCNNISNNDSDSMLFDRLKKICLNVNDCFKYPYEVFNYPSTDIDRLPIENFLMMTNHLNKASQQECIGENADTSIKEILQENFDLQIIQLYISERNLLIQNFLQYFTDEEINFYTLGSSYNEKDKTWIISTTKEKFVILTIYLPIRLEHHWEQVTFVRTKILLS